MGLSLNIYMFRIFYVLFITLIDDFEAPLYVSCDVNELYDLKSSYETFLHARCRILEFSSDMGKEF